MTGRRIVVLVPNFPSRVQTFIAQELASLEQIGHRLVIYPLKARGNDAANGSPFDTLQAKITPPSRNIVIRFARLVSAWQKTRHMPGYADALRLLCDGLSARTALASVANFAKAIVIAPDLSPASDVLYAQFFKHPASVAKFASAMTGTPWTCSAHARDIWLATPRDMKTKLQSVSWVSTCTGHGAAILRAHTSDPGKIHTVMHGVVLENALRRRREHSRRDGSDAGDPVLILSVGRIVEKKGFTELIQALGRIPSNVAWRFEHIGPGNTNALQRQAKNLGIKDRVRFLGYQTLDAIEARLHERDLFALACIIDRNGDMDGLPNSLAEAAAQATCCVTTSISEIPALFADGKNALLVDQKDVEQLELALRKAIADPELRQRIGQAAAATIAQRFDHHKHMEKLSELFRKLP